MYSRCALGVLAATLALVGGCGGMQRPEIRAVRPLVTGIDLQGVDLTFEVDIHNPYPLAIRAPRFDYGIDIEEREFLRSQAPVEIDVPAGRVGTARLPVRVEYLRVWQAYRSLADTAEVPYRLRGTVPITALGQTYELPLAHEGKLPTFRLPQIELEDIDFSEVSVSSARAMVKAKVRNPNAFALGARGLGYALLLGDTPVGSLTAATPGTIQAGGTGELRLSGEVTGRSVLARVLQGGGWRDARIAPTGTVETPFGPVRLGQ